MDKLLKALPEPKIVKIAKTLKVPRYYKRKLKLIGRERV